MQFLKGCLKRSEKLGFEQIAEHHSTSVSVGARTNRSSEVAAASECVTHALCKQQMLKKPCASRGIGGQSHIFACCEVASTRTNELRRKSTQVEAAAGSADNPLV